MTDAELMVSEICIGPDLDSFQAEYGITDPTAYIYGLHDPRAGELRYIGKSIRPHQRLQNQINERANTHRCHWFEELRSLGLRPVQVIIDAVPADTDWQTIERVYIAAARNDGCRLVNGTDGGDGVSGLSGESLARRRATWIGRKHKPETLAKLSAAQRGRRHTNAWREEMRQRFRARTFTPEWTSKISASLNKLTDEQVGAIRQRLKAGHRQRDIAVDFGVHQGTVSNIARGRTYRSGI
ncbi:MAG: hypothetical protein ACRDQA_05780 [Nocardioidaceae bacterium]